MKEKLKQLEAVAKLFEQNQVSIIVDGEDVSVAGILLWAIVKIMQQGRELGTLETFTDNLRIH